MRQFVATKYVVIVLRRSSLLVLVLLSVGSFVVVRECECVSLIRSYRIAIANLFFNTSPLGGVNSLFSVFALLHSHLTTRAGCDVGRRGEPQNPSRRDAGAATRICALPRLGGTASKNFAAVTNPLRWRKVDHR